MYSIMDFSLISNRLDSFSRETQYWYYIDEKQSENQQGEQILDSMS